jgi:hypothetical protein
MNRATEATNNNTVKQAVKTAQFVSQRVDRLVRRNIGRQADATAASSREGQRLMADGPAALATATHTALCIAARQKWPVLEGERKLGLKVALAAASLDPACAALVQCARCRKSGRAEASCERDEVRIEVRLESAGAPDLALFAVTRADVMAGEQDPARARFVRESAQVTRLLLSRPDGASEVVLAEPHLVGVYHVRVSLPGAMVDEKASASCVTYEDSGAYDFSAVASTARFSASTPSFAVRVPLHLSDALASTIAPLQLPSAELQLVLERRASPQQGGRQAFAVATAELVLFLRPSAQWLSRRWHVAALAAPRDKGLYDAMCIGDDVRHAQCATRPTALRSQIERLVQGYLGRQAQDNVYRLTAYQGSMLLASATNEHQEHHFRLGQATEVFTCIGLVRHVVRHSPHEWHRVSFHTPAVTEYFLRQSGATRLLEALKRAYATTGDGRLPTLEQLMNHTSGLPDLLPAASLPVPGSRRFVLRGLLAVDVLTGKVLGGQSSDEELARQLASYPDDPAGLETALAEAIEARVMPLFEPGTRFHHSNLGYALLRFFFRDWRSKEALYGMSHVVEAARDLGVPSATFDTQATQARCAQGPARGSVEPSLYGPSLGLAARPEELALFLSARNPWGFGPGGIDGGAASSSSSLPPAASADLQAAYSFLSRTVMPRTLVEVKDGVYFSDGWYNVPLNLGEGARLRALVSAGCLDETHVVVMCMVPAASLSFCFATTAPLSCLTSASPDDLAAKVKRDCSVRRFVQDTSDLLLRSVSQLESSHGGRARVFSHELNAQLAAPPDGDIFLQAHQRHAQRLQFLFETRLENLKDYADQEYVSLLEEVSVHARAGGSGVRVAGVRATLALRRRAADAASLEKAGVSGLMVARARSLQTQSGSLYVLEESMGAGQDVSRFALAYDASSFADPSRARDARGSAATPSSGVYRAMSFSDGLPGEHVVMMTYTLERPEEGCRDKEPFILYHGHVYVRAALAEAVRRHLFPTESEKAIHMSQKISAQQQQKAPATAPSAVAASPASSPGEAAARLVGQLLTAAPASSNSAPPASALVERGGFGGGRGFGGGFGTGLALGMATGALGYPYWYRPYYAYPVYQPVPAYAPAVVGPVPYYA